MLRKIAITAISALTLSAVGALANEGTFEPETTDVAFSFEGPFGKFDEHQLQRGLQVYTEVCSACHGMKFVAIRSLGDEGGPHLPEDQVRAYAKAFPINDEASNPQLFDQEKEAFRALEPADKFPANNSVGAPDLSLMAKARKGYEGPYGTGISQFINGIGGPEHIVSILDGYTGEEKEEAGETFFENKAFSTGWIKMNPPLSDGQVTYADAAPNDVRHMSEDVAAFLMWAAEPEMMARKRMGFLAVGFLGFMSVLLYLTNKRLWAGVKGKKTA